MTNKIVQALETAEAWVEKEVKAAVGVVEADVVPTIEQLLSTFANQFITDFGKAALTIGAQFVTNLLNKTTTIATAAPHLVQTIINTGIQIGEQDALTVAGNALRVLVTNATTPASPAAPVAATTNAQVS